VRRQQIDVVSLKKIWLRRRLLCISKIAEAHAHQPVALLGAEIYSVSQLQGYFRQFITGSRRMVRRVAACEDLEFFGLQLENDGPWLSRFLAGSGPELFCQTPDHRFGFRQQNIFLKSVFH
jgi:hypothetical protein